MKQKKVEFFLLFQQHFLFQVDYVALCRFKVP